MNTTDGIFAFKSENQNNQRLWSWLTALATAVSAALICYAFLNAVGGSPDPLYAVIAVVTVALEAACLPHKKAFAVLNIGFAAVFIFLIVTGFSTFLNGGFLMINRIFTASQEAQSYSYQMMNVTIEEQMYPFAEFFFNGVVVFAFSAALAFYSLQKIPFLPILVLFIVTVSEQYFGVAPKPILNVALYLAMLCLIMASSYKGSTVHRKTLWQSGFAVVLAAALLLSSTFFIYPARYHDHNPYVDEINEKIRDWLDKDDEELPEDQQDSENHMNTVEQDEADGKSDEERDPDTLPVEDDPEDDTNTDDPQNSNTENGESGSQQLKEGEGGKEGMNANENKQKQQEVPKNASPLLLLLLLLLLLAALIWAAIVLAAANKRKKKLADPDNNAVIHYAFSQSVKWLRCLGLSQENVPQSALIKDAAGLIDDDFGTRFGNAVNTWQEALYSNRKSEDYKKEEILSFYALTKTGVWHKAKLFKKLHIKLIDLL